jgi:two-component system cell cycle response regulator
MEKVLLVDDVRLFLDIQKGYFSGSSVVVITAANGQEALSIAERALPNLIIIDRHMPVMDGIACCKAIRAHPKLKQIPVVLLSNDIKQRDIEEYKAAGFNDWLPKQVDRDVFLETARKYLRSPLRRHMRVPFSAQIYEAGQADTPIGTAIDLSLSGLCIESGKRFTPNDRLTLSFAIPGNDAPLEVNVKVAWQRTAGGESHVGFEFIEITGRGMPFIRKNDLKLFIDSRSKTGRI